MIHIEDDWYILVDEMCYALQKKLGTRIDKQTGKEVTVWSDPRYYSSLYKALQGYLKVRTVEILKGREIELRTALSELYGYYTRIEDLLKEILKDE